MNAVITSDLHLGSPHCNHAGLRRFLEGLAHHDTLVLNGDVRDRFAKEMTEDDQAVFDAIVAETARRRVIWLEGNHDRCLRAVVPPGVESRQTLQLDNDVLVAHGHNFCRILFYARPLTFTLYRAYRLRQWIVRKEEEHVAAYAKRWKFLYNIIRFGVRQRAISHARRHGFSTVICGHSHYVEDVTVGDVRYINTGAWTESPVYCVRADGRGVHLEPVG